MDTCRHADPLAMPVGMQHVGSVVGPPGSEEVPGMVPTAVVLWAHAPGALGGAWSGGSSEYASISSSTQASVYCVAAVLWMAAKFTVPRGRKLVLPRRLKALLLDMARCSAQERPSAAEVIKVTMWQVGS